MMHCPTPESLHQLLAESLPTELVAALNAHLKGCGRCQALLDRLTDSADLKEWHPHSGSSSAELKEGPSWQRLRRELGVTPGERATSDTRNGDALFALSFLGPALAAGELGTLGPYRVQAELGHGGMGIVFRAYDPGLRRTVALKVLRPDRADPRARQRLVREAQLAAQCRHDHLVAVHAVVDPPDGLPYLVMEYLAGPTLAQRLRSQGRLEPREAAGLLAQVAEGLEAAHQAGLIHRDVKPSNIMVDPATGRAKLMDFGLARADSLPSGLTHEGILAGTPTYMSPEQAQATEQLDGRSDVYGLGATLYETLTGEAPFRGTPPMVLHQVLHDEPRPPRRLNERIPRDLETICLKALAKEPERRYQAAQDLADDLRRFLRALPIRARPAGTLARLRLWSRRRPLVAGLSAALVVVFLAGAGGITWKWVEAIQHQRQAERERDSAQQQREEAQRQRERAVRNFRQAREAVDAYLTRVSEHPDLKAHAFEALRRELLQSARDFYERLVAEEPEDPEARAELGRAHGRLGLITAVLESQPRGLEHYQKMEAIFAQLHEEFPDNPTYQDELAESLLQQAISNRAMGRYSPAEAAYERSRALRQDLVQRDPSTSAWRYQLARTLKEQGAFYLYNANVFERAAETLQTARALHEGLPEADRAEVGHRYAYGLVVLYLGKAYGFLERLGPQSDCCAAAAAILGPLARAHPESPDYAFYATEALGELANAYLQAGHADRAETTFREALVSAEELARAHPAHAYYQHAVADVTYGLANLLYHERQRPAEARPLFGKALDIEERLVLSQPEVIEYGFYYGNLLRDHVNLFGDRARLETALARVASALDEPDASPTPPSPPGRQVRADRLGLRGSILILLHRSPEAVGVWHQRAALRLEEDRIDPADGLALVEVLALVESGQHAQAAARAAHMEEHADQLAGGKAAFLYTLGVVYARLADAADKDGALEAARRQALVEQYAAHAVDLLRQAQTGKFFATPSTRHLLADERDLDPLRGRADFQKLLAEATTKPGP